MTGEFQYIPRLWEGGGVQINPLSRSKLLPPFICVAINVIVHLIGAVDNDPAGDMVISFPARDG